MEWIIRHVLKIPFIYDFDDAIWMPDTVNTQSTLLKFTKYPEKVGHICRWSYKVSCGNSFLADFAKQHNPSVSIIPTTIDTQNYHIPVHPDHTPLIIGWTGSHSTLPYLEELIPVLKNLRNRFDFVLKVICNKQPGFKFPGLVYINWSKQSEIAELNAMDIGIMPLPDTDWSKGKCGFKILQYMALEKPAVASAVGVNTEIIQHAQNGLLCYRQSDWSHNLELLLTDKGLRNKLGKNGRVTVEHHYSKSAIATSFMSLFDSLNSSSP
jgi:glycosyltransferase involved in cell wall biosynthesis